MTSQHLLTCESAFGLMPPAKLMTVETSMLNLEPLPYHRELRDYLKSEEAELWRWFASVQARSDYTESLRLDLLKATYRLDHETHGELHQMAREVAGQLQLHVPIHLYQAQSAGGLNAALFFIPGEIHIVFSGSILSLLNPAETRAVLGHEMAHYHLWTQENGEYHVAHRLVHAIADDPRSTPVHEQTARRFQLYTEVFADRGAAVAAGGMEAAISTLVKLETGLQQVNPSAYLQQAHEIFSKGAVFSQGVSHPECFIRARALSFWHQGDPTLCAAESMIEGPLALEELDVLAQRRLTSITKQLLQELLRPKWFQTQAVLGHARMFFPDFNVPGSVSTLNELPAVDDRIKNYFCYLLLDFAKADPELEELPLAASLLLSRRFALDGLFEKLAAKELKKRVREIRELKDRAEELLAQAEVSHE